MGAPTRCSWSTPQSNNLVGKTGHGWSMDHRNNPKNLISEIQLLNHDFLVNTELTEGKSVLSRALDE